MVQWKKTCNLPVSLVNLLCWFYYSLCLVLTLSLSLLCLSNLCSTLYPALYCSFIAISFGFLLTLSLSIVFWIPSCCVHSLSNFFDTCLEWKIICIQFVSSTVFVYIYKWISCVVNKGMLVFPLNVRLDSHRKRGSQISLITKST